MFNECEFIQSTRLPNGVLLLTETVPNVESVALGIWSDAGSADEGPDAYGQAHFLEHMLFKGTTRRNALDLAEIIEDLGGSLNAYTERETTTVYTRVLPEHVPAAVELLADMVCHSTFPQEEMDRERQVILEEILKYESVPEERIHDLVLEGLWAGGGLGHAILGTEESIQRLTRDDIMRCWRRHFNPQRVLITAAGKLEHQALVEMVGAAFADLPPYEAMPTAIPAGAREPLILDEEEGEQINFSWGGRSYAAGDPRNFALALVDSVLGGSTTSRLFQEVREKRGLVYDISSFLMGFRQTGMICVNGAASLETFPEVLTLVRREIDNLRQQGLSERELQRARAQMKIGIVLSLESTVDRMRRLAQHQLTWGEVYSLSFLIERLNEVTMEDVCRVMDEVLNPEHWTFAAIGPLDEETALSLIEGED